MNSAPSLVAANEDSGALPPRVDDVLEAWPHAFVVLDAERRSVLAFNRRFEALVRLAPERSNVLRGASVEALVEACAPVLAEGSAFASALRAESGSAQVSLRDGSALEIGARPLGHSWLVVLEDATARLRAEDERRTVERRRSEDERLNGLSALAGGIAHEFNNLLTGILGSAELVLEQTPEPDARRRPLERILEAGVRAARLCEELIVSLGAGTFEVRRLHLSDLVHHELRRAQSETQLPARVEEQLHGDLPAVAGDEAQLRRVLESVFLNACEALETGGGVVRVSTGVSRLSERELQSLCFASGAQPGEYVWFEVADDGPGMDALTQARMFDPFFSTKPSKRGLGLSSVARIVRAHHGAIEVDSELGRGTRLRVLVPVCE